MTPRKRRAERALERQLEFQARKADLTRGHETSVLERIRQGAEHVRGELAAVRPIETGMSILEVGSGAHGHIFSFAGGIAVGVDPLAVEYAHLFGWQKRVSTVAAFGERLPFRDGSFDVVLCDNVVDHAEDPATIVAEIARVLAPGGTLYFTVNVHHRIYDIASRLHGLWNAAGIRFEIAPFADHTVHLTIDRARRLVADPRLKVAKQTVDLETARASARRSPARHAGDRLKRLFFKNALFTAVAVRV